MQYVAAAIGSSNNRTCPNPACRAAANNTARRGCPQSAGHVNTVAPVGSTPAVRASTATRRNPAASNCSTGTS
ncbi:hypothetical protein AAFH96_12025 [Polymorphospora sp. 2-325]|uniref:Uncharacterized protein n=1 Tax=Polymorphospora lycopeni TaxID=3140240 RepID=A0ABV5CPH7_9ACTN